MNAICYYCKHRVDLRYLTIHTILAHHIHEEPTDRESKLIDMNPLIYYSVKFLYDDDYINTPYSDKVNKRIIDAIIRNEHTIEIEVIINNNIKHHLINLHTMKILKINTSYCNCFESKVTYDLVVHMQKLSNEPIYRSILINNCSDKIYPLRTEYFKHIYNLHEEK